MNIILVEDNVYFARTLIDYIENELQYNVVKLFVDGKEFNEHILEYKYDIILMDINLPKLNGIDAVKKHDWYNFSLKDKIIAITFDYNVTLYDLLSTGFKGCVFKDDIHKNLKTAITAVLDNNYFWSNNLRMK